jgi:hypothetical protein
MTEMVAPIVIDEHGDIQIYQTVAIACRSLEAIDVLNDEFEAFDSNGRALVLLAQENRVSLALPADSHPNPAELERRLRRYINAIGADRMGVANLDRAPLAVMLQALISFDLGFRESRIPFWRRLKP